MGVGYHIYMIPRPLVAMIAISLSLLPFFLLSSSRLVLQALGADEGGTRMEALEFYNQALTILSTGLPALKGESSNSAMVETRKKMEKWEGVERERGGGTEGGARERERGGGGRGGGGIERERRERREVGGWRSRERKRDYPGIPIAPRMKTQVKSRMVDLLQKEQSAREAPQPSAPPISHIVTPSPSPTSTKTHSASVGGQTSLTQSTTSSLSHILDGSVAQSRATAGHGNRVAAKADLIFHLDRGNTCVYWPRKFIVNSLFPSPPQILSRSHGGLRDKIWGGRPGYKATI